MRLKFLLRPGWIALIVLVGVFSSLCFTMLSPWQFSRDDQAQARNSAIRQSFETPAKPLGEVLPAGRAPDEATEWSEVSATGRYLPEGETLGWLRTVRGEPAIEVLTPFRTDNGPTVLINRGYLRPVDGVRAPDYAPPPTGEVTLTARVRVNETDSKDRPTFHRDGHRWTYSVDSRTVSEGTGIELSPGYFSLTAGQPGVLEPLPLPQLESGPYFSYALQWIAFGIMAPLALGYLIYAEITQPQPQRHEQQQRHDQQSRPRQRKRSRKMSVAETIAEEERLERENTGSG
ncbi:SURF1 family cytochrome oxidase biogenesis protein [Parasphingorhabdus pacifica]